MSVATRLKFARKLVSVLSSRVTMARNSLILAKLFSIKWRHLYISWSQVNCCFRLFSVGSRQWRRVAPIPRAADRHRRLCRPAGHRRKGPRSGAQRRPCHGANRVAAGNGPGIPRHRPRRTSRPDQGWLGVENSALGRIVDIGEPNSITLSDVMRASATSRPPRPILGAD